MNVEIDVGRSTTKALQNSRYMIPIKTGNLRYNGVKLNNGIKLKIYVDDAVAPYGKWINEPGYKTAGWWDKFVKTFVANLSTNLEAEIGPTTVRQKGGV